MRVVWQCKQKWKGCRPKNDKTSRNKGKKEGSREQVPGSSQDSPEPLVSEMWLGVCFKHPVRAVWHQTPRNGCVVAWEDGLVSALWKVNRADTVLSSCKGSGGAIILGLKGVTRMVFNWKNREIAKELWQP